MSLLSLLGFASELSKQNGLTSSDEVSTRATPFGSEVHIFAAGTSLAPGIREGLFDPTFKIADGRMAVGNWNLFTAQQAIQSIGGTVDVSAGVGGGILLTLRFLTA